MTQHTPVGMVIEEIVDNAVRNISDDADNPVALPSEWQEAYRLIDAAPALLEALEEAHRWLLSIGGYGRTSADIRIGAKSQASKVRAAIALAKGDKS